MDKKIFKLKDLTIEWVGHSTVGIYGDKVIYIDPFSEVLGDDPQTADLIISTHNHRDHFDIDAINKISNSNTYVILTPGCDSQKLHSKNIIFINIGESKIVDKIKIKAVHAYNTKRFREPNVPFHPMNFGMGVLIYFQELTFYYAGDTDLIEQMKPLKKEKIDVAFLPIGGTYTMDVDEAVEAVSTIQPLYVIPVHYNYLKATVADPIAFMEKIERITNSKAILLEGKNM